MNLLTCPFVAMGNGVGWWRILPRIQIHSKNMPVSPSLLCALCKPSFLHSRISTIFSSSSPTLYCVLVYPCFLHPTPPPLLSATLWSKSLSLFCHHFPLPPPSTTPISPITLPVVPSPNDHSLFTLFSLSVSQFSSGTSSFYLPSQLHHKHSSASAFTQHCPPQRHKSHQEAQLQKVSSSCGWKETENVGKIYPPKQAQGTQSGPPEYCRKSYVCYNLGFTPSLWVQHSGVVGKWRNSPIYAQLQRTTGNSHCPHQSYPSPTKDLQVMVSTLTEDNLCHPSLEAKGFRTHKNRLKKLVLPS